MGGIYGMKQLTNFEFVNCIEKEFLVLKQVYNQSKNY